MLNTGNAYVSNGEDIPSEVRETAMTRIRLSLQNGNERIGHAVDRLTSINNRLYGPRPEGTNAKEPKAVPSGLVGEVGELLDLLERYANLLHKEIERLNEFA